MNKQEKIEKLKNAQELILKAINQIVDATSSDDYIRRTIVANLRIIANNEHSYFNSGDSLEDIINELEEEL